VSIHGSPASIVSEIFEEGWNRQRFDRLEDVLAAFTFHVRGTTRDLELDDLRRIVRDWHVGFPDFRFDVHAVVADRDQAAVHATLLGTNTGPWRGRPPTGPSVAVEHMFFFRFDGDVVTDVWELLDAQRLESDLSSDANA